MGEQHPKTGWSEDINGWVDYNNKWVRGKTVTVGWTTSINGLQARQLQMGEQHQKTVLVVKLSRVGRQR